MDDILEYFEQLLQSDDKIVVATSGGPDSMCLLHLLCEFKKKKNIQIIVAHVNHKLRSESEEEANFVKKFANTLDIPYEYMEITEYHHDNLENEARQRRYAFFGKLVHQYHAKFLMTAHHGDDLMETILMRLVRGSSIKGYSGFQREVKMDGYTLVRPLITLTKEEIQNYMDQYHYQYFIDQTNYSMNYTRNRYRMIALPFLKDENPLVHLKFLKFSQELQKVNRFIDDYIKELLFSLKTSEGLIVSKLKELDSFLLEKIVEYELSLIYINDLFLIGDKNKNEVIKLILNDKPKGMVSLPNDYLAIKEYDFFKIVHHKEKEVFHYILEDEVRLTNGIIKKIDVSDKKSNDVIRLNSKEIFLPLHVRSREVGDKICVKNLNGTKKVKDILINEKVTRNKRASLPIVTDDRNQILWIPGVKKSKFDVERNGIYDIILSYEEEKHE